MNAIEALIGKETLRELNKLEEIARNLCARLDKMAEDERQFGFEICHQLESISYDTFKIGENLKDVQTYMRGN